MYLITGGVGHLGFNIINELLKEDKKIRVLALPNDKNVDKLPKQIEVCYGDVLKTNDLDNFFNNINEEIIVIHCAGIVSISSSYNELVYNVNVNGTKNVVNKCLEYKVKKLIYISSVHAIPEKSNKQIMNEVSFFSPKLVKGLYAQTKAEASQYVLDSIKKGLNAVIIHPSGIIGPFDYGNGHLTQLIIDYCNGSLTAGVNGGYDFVDSRDVAFGICQAVKKGKSGECYILSNKYFKIKDILNMLSVITKKKKIKTFISMAFAKITAPLSELYYKIKKQTPLYTSYSLYTLSSNSYFSHEKATKELDYHPREMQDTLIDTIKFLKKQGRI